MQISSYVALSGQLALEKRMETLASNIANANTPGFKSEVIDFKSQFGQFHDRQTTFVEVGQTRLDMSAGGFTHTGNPLDLAVSGDAAFGFESATGIYYSRDGRLTLAPDGRLHNAAGHSVVDASNTPILLDPAAGEPAIGADGRISQNGKTVGQIGLYAIPAGSGFHRKGSAGFVPDQTPEAIVDFARTSVQQGYVEGSNVNTTTEMVNLIAVSRAFEAASTLADRTMEAERNALETLGGRG
jgi:flagellar basal-body rod protein FlgF